MTKKIALLAAPLVFFAGFASASSTLAWKPGWDNFSEPLDSAHSSVKWSLNKTSKKVTVVFTLTAATPSKIYQVAGEFFNVCPSPPATFGQFPVNADQGCAPYTRQSVTKSTAAAEFGVVTTDAAGFGTTTVTIGPIATGTYQMEFIARDGAGCFVSGGAGNGNDCKADFQSPGPIFGDTTTIVVP